MKHQNIIIGIKLTSKAQSLQYPLPKHKCIIITLTILFYTTFIKKKTKNLELSIPLLSRSYTVNIFEKYDCAIFFTYFENGGSFFSLLCPVHIDYISVRRTLLGKARDEPELY
jgi:hypothetical protein